MRRPAPLQFYRMLISSKLLVLRSLDAVVLRGCWSRHWCLCERLSERRRKQQVAKPSPGNLVC